MLKSNMQPDKMQRYIEVIATIGAFLVPALLGITCAYLVVRSCHLLGVCS
jgi:hypothetical protein